MNECNYTVSNITCQRWDVQTPHSPHFQPPENDRHHNYCRNPDADVNGPWCYTINKDKRWEYCNLTTCNWPIEISTAVPTIGMETTALPLTTYATESSTNDTVTAQETVSRMPNTNTALGLWYLYVIGAVALLILLTVVVLIVTLKKRGKVPSRGAVNETATTISLYEDVPEGTLQRARENTYTEIPFFAGYLTGYQNPTASESSGKEESVVSGSTDDTAVYQNVSNEGPSTFESSEAGSSPINYDRDQDATTYEIPTSFITEDLQQASSRDSGFHTTQMSNKQDNKRNSAEDCKHGDGTDDANCAIYRIPVSPKPVDKDEDGYETPCIRMNRPAQRVPQKKMSPSDSKMDATMIGISPNLIDDECEYEGAEETNAYSTPTSPVFPMGSSVERRYDFQTEDGYATVGANATTSSDAKDEYCTMDKGLEQRKNSEKVVTLSRTYVTMHSAKAPKSLKEWKKQLKLQGANIKRKTK